MGYWISTCHLYREYPVALQGLRGISSCGVPFKLIEILDKPPKHRAETTNNLQAVSHASTHSCAVITTQPPLRSMLCKCMVTAILKPYSPGFEGDQSAIRPIVHRVSSFPVPSQGAPPSSTSIRAEINAWGFTRLCNSQWIYRQPQGIAATRPMFRPCDFRLKGRISGVAAIRQPSGDPNRTCGSSDHRPSEPSSWGRLRVSPSGSPQASDLGFMSVPESTIGSR